jgi:hypothetical protein
MATTNGYTPGSIDIGDPESGKFLFESKDMGEIGNAMEILTKVDLELAYSSEKLLNLESLLIHIFGWENDFEAMAEEDISADCIRKALSFDFLSTILDSEVRELDSFLNALQALILDARDKISSCVHLRELFVVVEDKLHDSEESLKRSQDHVIEMKMKLAKLQMSNHNDWKYNSNTGEFRISNMDIKPHMQTVEQRHVLRMLEKSLGRELELEKKLTDLKQNEEDLKLKLRLTEQVAFCMEEAAEVVWGRFLEAENSAEVLMSTSKELVGKLQILQFNQTGSVNREDSIRSQLKNCTEELKAKEITIQNLNGTISRLIVDNSEVSILKEQVKLLEEQLKETESNLKKSNASMESSQDQIGELENIIESLKDNVDAAEIRAVNAETKIDQLTETNVELTEELGFVKSNNDSNASKMGIIEKQLRQFEHQLQHARASSEASQEQQNMLYSAIWDMETLIDELKQKVSSAENKTDNAEEQCIILSETNMELHKEIDFLRSRVETLEMSLNGANVEKEATAKDISIKSNLIMDLIMQLATERERIKKQLYSLAEKNRNLAAKLAKTKNDAYASPILNHNVNSEIEEEVVTTETTSNNSQVEELIKDEGKNEERPNISAKNATNWMYIFMAILVLLVSALALYLFDKENISCPYH